jgi:poly-beta-1,6-N-acetyl-D-glucosamine synthase
MTIAFLLAAIFCLYTVIGYPLLLSFLAQKASPVKKVFLPRHVSVILPVRNGAGWIARKLECLLALEYPPELLDILVISDGSTDATENIAESYAERGVRLLRIPAGGKAAALNRGLGEARGEILFFTDVRQDLTRDSLRNLVACFQDPAVGAASGELVIVRGQTAAETSVGLYWAYEKWIRIRQSRIDSVIGATGCIYAMRRELARPLPANTLNDDMYLPLVAFLRGYRVILDESAKAFDDPSNLPSEFRRKVRTLAGVYQIVGFFPALLGPRNRMWLHFLSHKLARLLLPWALLVLAATSLNLPDPWRLTVWGAQLTVYGLAALNPAIPEKSPLKRLTSPLCTFVVLMAASLCAVAILFVPPRKLWKIR